MVAAVVNRLGACPLAGDTIGVLDTVLSQEPLKKQTDNSFHRRNYQAIVRIFAMGETTWESTWKEHSSAFDRIRSVVMAVDSARSALWIAEHAQVAESTAREHLNRLAEMGVVASEEANSGIQYRPDPAYVRFQEIRELTTEYETDTLSEFIVELKAAIDELRETYNKPSPTALREAAAGEDISIEESRELLRAAADWEHYTYRLSLIEDAIKRYDEYTGTKASA